MAVQHIVATLAGGNTKLVENKTEAEVVSNFIVPFLTDSTITTTWGTQQTRQALELRVYQTDRPYSRKTSGDFESFVSGRRNRYKTLAKKAEKLIEETKKARVFVVTPIQGDEYGPQEEQRIYREFDERFKVLEKTLNKLGCVAIRIDKEQPLDGMVDRIKEEIRRSAFVIADLTDERPSCYYELGYADGLDVPAICVASQDSVLQPGHKTRIHFDVHRQVLRFSNHHQLQQKVRAAFEKNRDLLLADRGESKPLDLDD